MKCLFQKLVFYFRYKYLRVADSYFKKFWFWLQGMEIGCRTSLRKLYVTWPHQVSIGRSCTLEQNIFFKYDGIWAAGQRIVIGNHCFVGACVEFNIRQGISVGDHCLIASGCKFIDHDHGYTTRDIPMSIQTGGAEMAITLEEDVWLGVNVVVLKGVKIGRGAIVAAGSVVINSIPSYEIWGGIPARKISERP